MSDRVGLVAYRGYKYIEKPAILSSKFITVSKSVCCTSLYR